MKTKINVLAILLIANVATARLSAPFSNWDQLEERSPYIIIAHCEKPIPPSGTIINGTTSDSAIEIVSVLKGATNVSSARLWTDHKLQQGENYLVFGYYNSGIYQAFEEYRVVPLGTDFSTNTITGKPLDEQLQILFKRRIDALNQEMQNDAVEKERLEEAIKK